MGIFILKTFFDIDKKWNIFWVNLPTSCLNFTHWMEYGTGETVPVTRQNIQWMLWSLKHYFKWRKSITFCVNLSIYWLKLIHWTKYGRGGDWTLICQSQYIIRSPRKLFKLMQKVRVGLANFSLSTVNLGSCIVALAYLISEWTTPLSAQRAFYLLVKPDSAKKTFRSQMGVLKPVHLAITNLSGAPDSLRSGEFSILARSDPTVSGVPKACVMWRVHYARVRYSEVYLYTSVWSPQKALMHIIWKELDQSIQ